MAELAGALAGGGADENEAQVGLQLVGELFQFGSRRLLRMLREGLSTAKPLRQLYKRWIWERHPSSV
jgi:hypothetical protein